MPLEEPVTLPFGGSDASSADRQIAMLMQMRSAIELFPGRLDLRCILAKVLVACDRLDEAEAELRTAVAHPGADRETSKQLALVLRLQGELEAAFDVMAAAPARPTDGSNILIACMQKSGSSWLREMIGAFEFVDIQYVSPRHDRREQELDLSLLSKPRPRHFVAQHHVRATGTTEYAVANHNITTVVLVRNLFDNLVSARDQFQKGRTVAPQFYIDDRFKTWDRERQYWFLVDFYVPWVINFLVSWWNSRIDTLWLTYDILLKDPERALRCVLEQAGFAADVDGVAAVVKHVAESKREKTLFNVAKTGRGAELSPEVRNRVRALCDYYPDVPFERMGLL